MNVLNRIMHDIPKIMRDVYSRKSRNISVNNTMMGVNIRRLFLGVFVSGICIR